MMMQEIWLPAESLKDHHPRVINEIIQTSHEEEIIDQHCLTISQLSLGSVKIKVDIQILNEASDRVLENKISMMIVKH